MPALLLAALALAAPAPDAGAVEPPNLTRLASPPWHLVDLWWNLGQPMVFQSLSVDVTFDDDLDPSLNLYVSTFGKLSGQQFYGGLQTHSRGRTRTEPTVKDIGPGTIFSRWGPRSDDQLLTAKGGVYETASYEGDFASVRLPFSWHKGTYTLRFTRTAAHWVGMFVRDHATREESLVGELQFESDAPVLDQYVVGFIELYGQPIPVEKIPKTTIRLSHLLVNDQVAPVHVNANFADGTPDVTRCAFENGEVVCRLGVPTSRNALRKDHLF